MKKILLIILITIALLILGSCVFYNLEISAVSSNSKEVEFMVNSGSTYYSIANDLYNKGLIKNKICFKLYVKFNHAKPLEAGKYTLNKNMSVNKIIKVLSGGNSYNKDAIVITFKEGKNMRSIASTISKYTNNTEDQVFNLLNDQEYLKTLIEKYWFISDEILDQNIYYSLEGYLYPNTYEFTNKDVSVKDIFNKMLDEMDNKLSPYKTDLTSNKYTIYNLLTLASIVELEGSKSDDRAGIAGVFYNRLNNNWSLGSDVTTYYAAKIELSDRDLYSTEINDKNYYNTRSSYLAGKLPIGPISNPSIESIKAVLYPEETDNFYFVSDVNGKTYFSKTYQEHNSIKNDLIEAGLWYTYE